MTKIYMFGTCRELHSRRYLTLRRSRAGIVFHAWSPDSRQVVSVGDKEDEDNYYFWDAVTGALTRTLTFNNWASTADYTPDGRLILLGLGGCIRIVDTSTWKQSGILAAEFDEYDGYLNNVSVSPDGTKVAAGTRDGKVDIWNIKSGQLATHAQRTEV